MLELIFQGFAEWAYELVLECWEYFSTALLDIMSMDYAYMKSHVPVMDDIIQVLMAVGWALLIGNLVFQALKSMMSGLGFEGEDPKLLFTRSFVFSFLLLASPQICEIGLSITARIIDLLQVPTAVHVTLVDKSIFGTLTASWLLAILFGIIIIFKTLRLLLEIAERYVILAVLTMTAPLAFAMGGSKSTADIFTGWCRMYGSMCLLMVTNVIFFKMLLSVLSTVPSGLDVFLWIVLILTLVKVARKADAIITRIGLNPAITGDSLGRPLPGALTYMVVRSAASHITKSVGKSAGGRGSGFSSGASPSGRGPRTGGPFGGGRFAGYTASGFYQKAQRQSAQQGAGERAYASHSDTVQTGRVQTASQEHSAASMSQSSSVIRQQTFKEGAKRNGAALHGTRQTPAPASPASRNLSDSVRTLGGRHGPAGTQAAPSLTRISQANTQTTQSRSVTGQTVRNTTSITGQKPPAGTAGNTSPASEEGRHNASPPPAQTRYTQRPVQTVPKAAAQRAAARQTTLRAESPRPGPAGTTPPPSVPALTVEPRPGRNLSQARTAPFEQARQHDSAQQEPRTVGDGSARPMRGAVSVQHPGPAGNGANSREKAQSRPIAGARMSMPKTARTGGLSKPSVTEAMKGAGKKEKALTPSRKQRGKKHEGT
ncbi:MAG: conjugal transfer protein TrbL family protein [Oscillospiraceae bacterium]